MKVLLLTPPLLQPNTPYAATPLLKAWLGSQGLEAVQADLSIELMLRLFSPSGLAELSDGLELEDGAIDGYLETIDEVMAFLQGRNAGAAEKIATRGWLPEGEHLDHGWELEEQLGWNFGGLILMGGHGIWRVSIWTILRMPLRRSIRISGFRAMRKSLLPACRPLRRCAKHWSRNRGCLSAGLMRRLTAA